MAAIVYQTPGGHLHLTVLNGRYRTLRTCHRIATSITLTHRTQQHATQPGVPGERVEV